MTNDDRKIWAATRTDRYSSKGGYRGRPGGKQNKPTWGKGQDHGENFDGDYDDICKGQ